jgi:DNA-directed RNA polymerase sigma subunit (sigma70/sigma32)
MRIDNTYLKNLEVPSQTTASGSARPVEARSSGETANSLQAASQHVPSPELLRYLDQLRDTPEVRPQELARVAARLQQGHYSTAEAAQQTAEAILKAAE